MPLAAGTRLGNYEIVGPLGAGGMGEVYRGRDTKLDREVAIKVLPAAFAQHPDRLARFEREAKVLASLKHNNIATIYAVEESSDGKALVMELVEGATLKGPVPLDTALKYAAQIASALDAAHEKGITHRDLKPANIMLTPDGAIKVLDFGLAAVTQASQSDGEAGTNMVTLTVSPTQAGMIMGTAAYMSPEQARGQTVDRRADIWAFGVVLWELLTGKQLFQGDTVSDTLASVLTKEPDFTQVPPKARPLLRRCLEKDPKKRLRDIGDMELLLAEAEPAAPTAATAPSPSRLGRLPWIAVAGVATLAFLVAGAGWYRATRPAPSRPLIRLNAEIASDTPLARANVNANMLALSPDGTRLALTLRGADGKVRLHTRLLNQIQMTPLAGTDDASFPFFSPAGDWIGFFADGKLKKVEVSGGRPQVLCDAPNARGGSWNQDGVIVFTPDAASAGLFRVSSSGGSPVAITKLDASRSETSHRWPVFLPDGKHFLYLGANFSGLLENNAIFLGSLDSQERRLLVSTSANAAFAEPGYLLYLRDNKTLVAQPFDLRRYVLSGEPFPLSDEVLYFPQVDRAVYSVSSGDVLVTQSGKGLSLSQLTWFDRGGKPAGTVGAPGSNNNVRLSPDGHRVAGDQTEPDGRRRNIWIHELAQGLATTRLTFDPSFDGDPIWSPDGKQILFFSNRRGGFRLYLKNADGSGYEEEVADLGTVGQGNAWDWSRNGKYVLVRKGNELWSLSWPERVTKPLLQATWTVRNAQFSPDGRWIVYASNETGSMEIYVSPFPSINGKWQVSSGGGQEPRWRQDGKELFYLSADGKMMAVAVTTGASFKAGSPVALFQTHRRLQVSSLDDFSYDVSGDGQRFLIATKVDEANAAPLSVLLNWVSQMEK